MELNLVNQNGQDTNLEVLITEADYQPKLKEEIKKIRKQAKVPGFRQGHVPRSLVLKQYGTQIKIQAIEEALNKTLQEHLEKEKESTLINPMVTASEVEAALKEGSKNFMKTKEFKVTFITGNVADIDLKQLVEEKGIEGFEVKVSDEEVADKIDEIREGYAAEVKLDDLTNFPEDFKDISIKASIKELSDEGEVLEEGFSKEDFVFKIDEEKGITEDHLKKIFSGDYQSTVKANLVDVFGKEDFIKIFSADEQIVDDIDTLQIEVAEVVKREKASVDAQLFEKLNEFFSESDAIKDKKIEDEAVLKRVVKHELENDGLRLKAIFVERGLYNSLDEDESISLPEEARKKLLEEKLREDYTKEQKEKEEENPESFEAYKERELPKMEAELTKGLKMQSILQNMQKAYPIEEVTQSQIISHFLAGFSNNFFIDYMPKGDERIFKILAQQIQQEQIQQVATQIAHTALFKQFAKDLSFKQELSLKEAEDKLKELNEKSKESADDNE